MPPLKKQTNKRQIVKNNKLFEKEVPTIQIKQKIIEINIIYNKKINFQKYIHNTQKE